MSRHLDEKNKIEYLKKIQLFSSLTADELHKISGKITIKWFRKNETILHEEDTNEFMYMIFSGQVKVIKTTGEGKEIILSMHQSGNFFGEMSLIDGKTIPASVVATEESLISLISKKEFFSMLYAQKKVLENLLSILSSRLRNSWESIKLLSFNQASQRIRTLFFMLADEYGNKTDEGVRLDIQLSHQEISEMTGLTRETVTRVLDKWQKIGEITIHKNKFIRLNPSFHKRIDLV
jgi:CRP/FNR family cyclic AMP-dependent transcriptional regulator